jgi:hypothetical protein
MCFDGSYHRRVCHLGVVHRVTIRRVRCPSCGLGSAVLPEFVLVGRLDSAETIGAALVTATGLLVPRQRITCLPVYQLARSDRGRHASKSGRLSLVVALPASRWIGVVRFHQHHLTLSPMPPPVSGPRGGPGSIDTLADGPFPSGDSPAGSPAGSSSPPAWICRGQVDTSRRYPPEGPDQGRQWAVG